jgi:uncharacterized protein YaiI (UPF0178 family)
MRGIEVGQAMTAIFVDADACPVKDEVYRVAKRYGLKVVLASNSWLRVPNEEWVELVVVGGELDAADAWIVEHVTPGDIVISADIPLAALCLEKGAGVLGPRGRPFTEDSIGNALATRELMSQLREMGEMGGGPPPFEKRDRSQFLQALDQMIHAMRNERR